MTSSKLGKKATKTKLKRKSPKGSVKHSLKPKEEEPTKRKTPQPPAPPKRRKRTQSEKPEKPKEPSSDYLRTYLSPTPKVKAFAAASTSKEEAEIPMRRKRVKASRKAALVEELPVAKSEPDYEPTEEAQGSKTAGVDGDDTAPATPDSSEKSSSEEEQQEPESKDVSAQLDSLKASMQAQAKPPVLNPPSLGLREEVKKNSSTPLDALVGRSQVREYVIAVLTLTSTCQRMLAYHDPHNSGRLHGIMVIVHEERCAIEFKILMHRPGHIIRIYQMLWRYLMVQTSRTWTRI